MDGDFFGKYVPFSPDYLPPAPSIHSFSQDILNQVIYSRMAFTRDTINEIYAHLRQRKSLKDALNSEIDEDISRIRDTLFNVEGIPAKSALERQVTDLTKEKRSHELAHWQDTLCLSKELRLAVKELRTAMLDLWMLRFLT